MSLAGVLNDASEAEARTLLHRCCACHRWVEAMQASRPFEDDDQVFLLARQLWETVDEQDVREALAGHPEIGANLETLRAKFAPTADWSGQEQAGVVGASEQTLQALAHNNRRYQQKFGFVFVVCATEKTADDMLAILLERLHNDSDRELAIAKAEQAQITAIRLEKLL
jgi:2-oxo-4-hydroxy-4-carboxy-5-ureidoimidazoline decarboxylase